MNQPADTLVPPARDAARARARRTAWRAALIYTLIGALWIVFSDRAVTSWFDDPQHVAHVQTFKGWFYVLATAVLVYVLVRSAARHAEALAIECAQRQQAAVELAASEQRLRLTSEQLRAIMDGVPIGMLTRDGQDCILDANPAFIAMVNRPREDVVGQPFARLLEDGVDAEAACMSELWDNHRQLNHRELRLRGADGRICVAAASSTLVRLPGEKPRFTLTMVRDVTEQKHAEARNAELETQLRHAQKMEAIGQLAGGVAHDFNNILTAILGNAELTLLELERDLETNRELTANLHEIERCAHRAAGLTQQLLTVSRRQAIEPKVLDLNRLLADLSHMLRRLIGEDIQFETATTEGLRPLRTDAGQIEQVIMNLVVNARDAMPGGGRLTVRTTNVDIDTQDAATRPDAQPGPHVLLSVSDTGQGIDAATLERIFEPFFTTKPVGRGTGLGLATVYGIVRQSGGHLRVASAVGKGTTFDVYLPAYTGQQQPIERDTPTQPPSHGPSTILLCEDDESVRRLAAQMLREAGYAVMVASDGEAALRLARDASQPIDLLVTDVIMPDMNGRELANRLRAETPTFRTLFVSGYPADIIAHRGILDEGLDYLEKPFTRADLLRRVDAILRPNAN